MSKMSKKVLCLMLAILLVLFTCTMAAYADDELEEGPVSVTFTDNIISTAGKPGIEAAAAVVMEAESGRVLYAKNPVQKRSIASTTKIMTAIVALENGKLYDTVEISEKAAAIWGSTIGLRAGQKYTLEELLYGMLMNSGNDAAIAIAEHIGGSVEKFAEMMNKKAKDIGAADSVFVTPHGLDADGQYSTAYDLAIITRYALKNKVFARIVATRQMQIEGHSFYNTNELLDIYPGTDGVKTGYTGKAGRCLVASVVRGNMRLISVVLGCASRSKRAEGSRNILEYCFKNYKMYELLKNGQELAELPVAKGKTGTVAVRAAEAVRLPLTEDEYSSLERSISLPDELKAPVYAGAGTGAIVFSAGGQELAQVTLQVAENVPKKGVTDYFCEIIIAWAKMMREGIFAG